MLTKFLNLKNTFLNILILGIGLFVFLFPFVADAAAPTSASISLSPTSVTMGGTFSASWSGNNVPTKYWVKVGASEYDMGSLTSWSGKPSDLSLSAGTHSFSVKACNSGGCGAYSSTKTLTVVTAPTSATVNLSPSSVPNNNSFTAFWSGNNSPTSFDVRVDSTTIYSGSADSWSGTPDSLSLSVGNYSITARACNIAGCSGWSSVKTLTVTSAAPTSASISLSPTSLLTTGDFTASWSGNNVPTKYWVKVGASEYDMGTLTSWSGKPSDLSLSAGTHSFSVKACNSGGCSAYSPTKTLTVTSPAPTSASISLSPSSVPSNSDFTASWSGDSSPTSYNVKVNSDTVDMGPSTSWTGTPEGLGLGTGNHSISVQACNSYGCSPWSGVKTLTVTPATISPTIATINLSPATVALDGDFTASWSGNNSPTGYDIKIDSKVIVMGADTSWVGTPASLSLTPGTHYVYVQACNSSGCSGWSASKTLIVTADAPTTASVNLSSASVPVNADFTASWFGNNGANLFNVKVDVSVFSGTSTSWTGTPEGLGLGTGNHSISVQACNSYGCSPWSGVKTLTVTTGAPTTAWMSLSEDVITQKALFTASWSSNNGPTAYKVKVDSTVFDMGAVTSWSGKPEDLGLTIGDHYLYAQGCNAYGCGPWSVAKPLTVMSTSSSFIITPGDEAPSIASISINPSTVSKLGTFTASWSGNNNPTSYRVKAGSTEFDMGMVTSWSGSPDSLGLDIGVYPISVQACNIHGCSPWSGVVNLTVTNSSIPAPTASSITVTQYHPYTSVLDNLTANWTGNNSPTSYNVKVNNTVYDMGNLTTWTGTPTSFALTPGTHYLYSQACNEGGCSPWSASVIFTVTGAATTPTVATITASPLTVSPTDNLTVNWSGNNGPTAYNVMLDSKVYNAGTYFGDGTWTGTPESLGLNPGVHKLYAQACNSGGCSPWSTSVSFTVTNPVVAAPTTATVTVSPGSVPVSGLMTAAWSGNNNPTYFNMKVGTTGDIFTVGSSISWTGTPLSIGLSAGFYSVYAQACNALGCSPWSVPSPLTVTGTASGVPPTTANIDITVPDFVLTPINGFCANWSGDNSPTNYNIKVDSTVYILGADPSTTWWCGTPSSIGLGVGTYSVYIQACNLSGCSPWSTPKPLVVNPIATAPTISNIYYGGSASPMETDIINVSWDGNNSPTHYNVMVDSLIYNVSAGTSWTGTPEAIGLTPGTHSLYSQACNSGGCSAWSSPITIPYSPTGITAPTLSFTASPTTVASGGTTNLTWSATNVTSCTASGDWSGAKILSDSEVSAPITSTKTYTLTCTGTGGNVSGNVTVTLAAVSLPAGTIDANNCLVTVSGTRTCDTVVSWNATGYPSPKVYKSGSPWLSLDLPADIINSRSAAVSFGGANFVLQDSSVVGPIDSVTARANCGPGLTYTYVAATGVDTCESVSSVILPPPPDITINAEPSLIRKGQTADISVDVTSDEQLSCQVFGIDAPGGVEDFDHEGLSTPRHYEFRTKALASAQIIKVKCIVDIEPSVSAEEEFRINVVSTGGEI